MGAAAMISAAPTRGRLFAPSKVGSWLTARRDHLKPSAPLFPPTLTRPSYFSKLRLGTPRRGPGTPPALGVACWPRSAAARPTTTDRVRRGQERDTSHNHSHQRRERVERGRGPSRVPYRGEHAGSMFIVGYRGRTMRYGTPTHDKRPPCRPPFGRRHSDSRSNPHSCSCPGGCELFRGGGS